MAGNVLVPSQTTSSGQTSSHSNNHLEYSEEYDPLTVPPHPLGIRPTGNTYTATENIKPAAGFFMRLPDELILQVLESLDATSLQCLGCTCKALYAFSGFEDLWKTLCIEYELLSSFQASLRYHIFLELPDLPLHRLASPIIAQEVALFIVSDYTSRDDVQTISLDPVLEHLLRTILLVIMLYQPQEIGLY